MQRTALVAALVYLLIAASAGYVYAQTASTVSLEPVKCQDRTYLINPEGVILEYKADITVMQDSVRTAAVVYQVAITGNPCDTGIPVYTPIVKTSGDNTLAALLINTGLVYPHTLTAPGAVDPAGMIYVVPAESLLLLRIQGGPDVGPGVGVDGRLWPGLTLAQTSQATLGGAEIRSLTKVTIDEKTGILREIEVATKNPQQEATISVTLQKVYLPTQTGEYIDMDRLAIAEATPALIAGFALTLSAYTLFQATRNEQENEQPQ